ncbi:MAG: class I SAM-dependent methyltransferase [Pseudomonadota bacterium]|nr:class I SAM-dependent methyltransferase [Pseudomonadota bacterium]
MHGDERVSPWVRRWSHLVPAGVTVLDVACGSGRHTRWFAARGNLVTGVDRDAAAVASLAALAEIVVADLETPPWPFTGRAFGAVVVTNYLWREGLPDLIANVADGGVLLYETFAVGNETLGKPSNPNYLLQPGELLRACSALRIVAYEDGLEAATGEAPARFVQRIVAVREIPAPSAVPAAYALLSDEVEGQVKSLDSEEPA